MLTCKIASPINDEGSKMSKAKVMDWAYRLTVAASILASIAIVFCAVFGFFAGMAD